MKKIELQIKALIIQIIPYYLLASFRYDPNELFLNFISNTIILFNRFFGYKSNVFYFPISSNLYGESIYDYASALAFLESLKKKDYKDKLIYVDLRGVPANKILKEWFDYNLKKLNLEPISSEINSISKFKYSKIIIGRNIISETKLKIEIKVADRIGSLNHKFHRADTFLNYQRILKSNKLISIDSYISNSCGKNTDYDHLKGKPWIVLYDYDPILRIPAHKLNEDPHKSQYTFLRVIDIKTLIPTIKYLIDKGFIIFRLGKASKEFPFKSPSFIDLAPKQYLDNSLMYDFTIPLRAKFCITTGTGSHEISRLYGLPMFFISYHRFNFIYNLRRSMVILKRPYNSKTNTLIPLSKVKKIMRYPYKIEWWNSLNIELRNPTSIEILESMKEFLKFYPNFYKNSPMKTFSKQQLTFLNKYHKNLPLYRNLYSSKFSPKEPISVCVSNIELKNYRDFYLS